MKTLLLIINLLFLLLVSCTIESQSKNMTITSTTTITDSLIQLQKYLDGGILSVCVSYDSDKIIRFNSNYQLPTASTIKLLTTAAGLAHLGEDFQFQTIFGYIGKLENNELRGDIVIKGEGDPSFMSQPESQIFERWVNVLKKQNIHRILGNIIADATIFEEQAIADTWFWEDIGNWYAGGTTGLNIFNNLYTVNFSPTKSVNFSPYQEFLIRQKYSKINTVNRFRLESRFFRTVVDGRITNDSRFNFRFRYQFILTIPLFKLFGRQVGLRLGNELFINAGRTITYNIFDRNNLLLGGSIHLSKNITAILTYNGQFLAFNRPAAYTYRHILWFIVSHKIDFTKKKEE